MDEHNKTVPDRDALQVAQKCGNKRCTNEATVILSYKDDGAVALCDHCAGQIVMLAVKRMSR